MKTRLSKNYVGALWEQAEHRVRNPRNLADETVWILAAEVIARRGNDWAESVLDQDLPAGSVSYRPHAELLLLADEALETPAEAAVVTTARKTLRSMKLNDRSCGVPFGSDASKLSRAGIPTIVFGPGSIDQAHAADEYVELAQVKQAMEFYRRFVLDFGA